jgi:hypothetical protein
MATRISLLVAGVAAAAAIIAGVWWIYPPAGLIVAGVLLGADVVHIVRSRRPSAKDEP